jgi:copper homeostasis protein
MADRIREFKAAGVDGVVLGVLTAAASVDEPALARLVRAADGLSVTFHRAFDCVDDRSAALRELESGGADRVLTLGYPVGAPRQPTDVERVSVAAGDAGGRLAVMTGGLLEDYAPTRLRAAGIREFHLGRAVREGESYERPIDPERVRAWRARLEGR